MSDTNKIESNEQPKYRITYASEYVDTRPLAVRVKEAFKVASIPAIIASLCCLSPIILFSLGIVSLSVAGDLANIFYGQYKWIFRGIGLAALLIAFYYYMRRSGVCTLDEAKRRRNEIINKLALVLIIGVIMYIVFLYVILHYIGVFQGIWQ